MNNYNLMFIKYILLFTMAIIQWNCRGFKVNFNELALLSQRYNPQAICLQETHFKKNDNIDMRGFTIYNAFSPDEKAKGGSSILVWQGVIHSEI